MNKTFVLPAIILIVAAICLGAATNLANVVISPAYFHEVMNWHDFNNIRGAAIAQGLIEGAIIGIVLAVVLLLITRSDKFEYSTSTMTRSCGIIVSLAVTCWAAGGLFGMLIAFVSPELALSRFPTTIDTLTSPYPVMWVGGSIMGLQLGGAASLIITALIIRKKAQQN